MGLAEDDLVVFGEKVARFLRQGGVFGWATFCCFNDDQQEVVARIADELQAVRCVQVGQSIRSSEGAARVLAPFDDGDAIVHDALTQFMDGPQ